MVNDRAERRLFSVAQCIVSYAVGHIGNTPSLQEIADQFDLSKRWIQQNVEALYGYGIAERVDGKLIIVGSTYVPPTWYLHNLTPVLSDEDRLEESRRNRLILPH